MRTTVVSSAMSDRGGNVMVILNAMRKDGWITISEDSFEHLLNCLDNQRFIDSRNANSATCDLNKVRKVNQAAIDEFNRQCRAILQ